MKVLIVGGTSSLGRALRPVLSGSCEVLTAGRKDCDIALDLSLRDKAITFPKGIDTVIHTAAHFGGKTFDDVIEAEYVNALGTLRLCRAAADAGAKHFVFISSIFSLLKEGSHAYGIYGLSKKHAEDLARLYCSQHSLSLTILRPSQVYGNEDRFRKHQPFFYSIIDKAEKGEDIELWGAHDALRNYIHINDLTQVIKTVVANKITGAYNVAHPENVSYSRVARAAIKAFNSKSTVRVLKEKDNVPDTIFDPDHSLYEKTGMHPSISIEEGMAGIAKYRNSAVSAR